MDDVTTQRFLLWSLDEICRNAATEDRDTDIRMSTILARAHMAQAALLGSEEDKKDLWRALQPQIKEQVASLKLD